MTFMTGERFSLDANILIYALDGTEVVKNEICKEIVIRSAQRDCVLTLQSLGEFYTVSTRKRGVAIVEAISWIEAWLGLFRSIAADERCVRAALSHAAAGRASYWDGLLMETASENGCTAVISEDMANSAVFGHARVVHAFAEGQLSAGVLHLLA